MFSKSHLGRVWTTITFAVEDKDGQEREVAARFLMQPLTRREYQSRRREQMQKANDAIAEATKPHEAKDGELQTPVEIAYATVASLKAQLDSSLEADESNAVLLAERTHDWNLIDEESKEAIPFDRGFMRDLLAFDQFYVPINQRFSELCLGAVRKNSSPGPAGVQA